MAYVAKTASTESASHPGWNAIATCRERNSLQLRTSARPTSSATTAPTVSCTAQTQGPGKVRCGGRAALSAGAGKRGPIQLGVAAGGGPPPPKRRKGEDNPRHPPPTFFLFRLFFFKKKKKTQITNTKTEYNNKLE